MKTGTEHKLIFWICCMGFLFFFPDWACAASTIKINVEVIKADQNSDTVDPGLEYLVKEVSPVLRFSGFTLLKKTEARLSVNEKEVVNLPLQRELELQFLAFSDGQARILVRIIEKQKEIFRTILLMGNQGSALIGGPPYEGGALILRVGARF